jgi:dCTP deaminase
MIREKQIWASGGVLDDQIQPASLDVRLGDTAYRIRASFLPGENGQVMDKLSRLAYHKIDLTQGAVLETGCVYLVPLMEALALPERTAGFANPKSSTGRIDVFTRVITDFGVEFDKVPAGYKGHLYLEVSPRTFPILVRTGSRLSQIRFRRGAANHSDGELKRLHEAEGLVNGPANISGGLGLSIDLKGDAKTGLIGYRGKRHAGLIDVDKPGVLPISQYWEPIYHGGSNEIILDPDEFYILASREAVTIPASHAAEMMPFNPLVGEFRVHYAGFFDPGFGAGEAGGKGSRAVLEVRSREVPFILEHGQIIGRLVYERLTDVPETLYGEAMSSNYQAQGLKLSKHFKQD